MGDKPIPPKPRCECNVYDHQGRPIAWRTWACPLHKWDGWLAKHVSEDGGRDGR